MLKEVPFGFNPFHLSTARLVMGREDPARGSLGPLKAREFFLGDVHSSQISLVTPGRQGRGLYINNFPKQRSSDFGTETIRGNAPTGWEVELYRNGTLLEFQDVSNEGQYEFVDVPLISGLNRLRLIFYSPFGEKQEEIHHFLMSSKLVPKGNFYYNIGLNQQDKNLIRLSQNTSNDQENPTLGQWRYGGEVIYGLTHKTSIIGYFSHLPLETTNEQRQTIAIKEDYEGIGLLSSFGPVYGRLNLLQQHSNQARAWQWDLQTNLWGTSITAKQQLFSAKFVSETHTKEKNPLVRNTEIRLNGNLWSSALGLTATLKEFRSGKQNIKIQQRLSTRIGPVNLSHNLNYNLNRTTATETTSASRSQTATGNVLLRGNRRHLTLGGDLQYRLLPEKQLSQLSLSANYKFNPQFNLQGNLHYSFPTGSASDNTSATLSLNRIFTHYTLGANFNVNNEGSYSAGLSLNVALLPNPRKKRWQTSQHSISQSGQISVQVFFDRNQNHQFDEAVDELVTGVWFLINDRPLDFTTNRQGVALLENIGTYQTLDLIINHSTLENPYWVAAEPTVVMNLRPGITAQAQFALLDTGEIDGTVYITQQVTEGTGQDDSLLKQVTKPVSQVQLELVNEKNQVVATRSSGFDGFYLFELVPVGNYTLRVSPDQMQRLGFNRPDIQNITLTSDMNISSGIDFTVSKK